MINNLLLVLTALIWGLAFVAQTSGTSIGTFTYNAIRCVLGILTLTPLFIFSVKKNKPDLKYAMKGGFMCGFAMFLGANLQQYGLKFTSAGKTGFLTAIYSVLVPVFGIFIGKKTGFKVWLSVLISMVGMYLLCVKEGFKIALTDLIIIGCAVSFAFQILFINHYSQRTDGIVLSYFQLATVLLLSLISSLLFEKIVIEDIKNCMLSILYTGICSTGIGYTLQVIAQKKADPTVASIIMSLESVFSALFGALILHERLSLSELIGCGLIFASVIISQLPDREKYIL